MSEPTLRDALAMAALIGLMTWRANNRPEDGWDFDFASTEAYQLADAMMKAREQT